jgi:hypothetical protein
MSNREDDIIVSASVPPVLTTKGDRKNFLPGEENIPQLHCRRKEESTGNMAYMTRGKCINMCERSQKYVIKRQRGRPKETGRVKSCATTDDDENESLTEDDEV